MTQKDPFREPREKIRRQQETRENRETAQQHAAAVKAQKELMNRRLAAARAKTAQRVKEEQAAQEKATLPVEYTVQSGDSLSAIALKFYGNAAHWEAIYKANRQRIDNNPSLFQVGQVFTIPKLN